MPLTLITVPSAQLTLVQTAALVDLCSRTFDLEYGVLLDTFPQRVHVLGYQADQLVAHALWLERRLQIGAGLWLNAAYVEGVAVEENLRRQGIGSALMRRVQAEIAGYDLGALSAAAPEWYARLGWQRWLGRLFIVQEGRRFATPDEDSVMVWRTASTGEFDTHADLVAEWRPFELW
jgi:GNAT superfamily N-acetyltransferase